MGSIVQPQTPPAGKTGPVTLRESYFPVSLVTTLFFLWGFAYGMLDVLNKHFQNTLGVSKVQSSGLQAAYFGAYFVSPMLFSVYVLRRWGYKYTFMLGLIIYGVGAILFWPCAKYRSFAGFCVCTFVIGLGLGTLEVSANPYIASCGPMEYSSLRLNFSQAFNGIGKVVGPLIAADTFFNSSNGDSLASVYLGVTVFVWSLAAVFYFSPIPEISDDDMQHLQETIQGALRHDQKPFLKQHRLFLAVFAQFMYVGAEVAVGAFYINYVEDVAGYTDSKASKLLSVAQGIFTLGRFMCTLTMRWIHAKYILTAFISTLVVVSALASFVNGTAAVVLYTLLFLFESLSFPTIFALGLMGLGRYTKRGAGLLIQSIIGGACFSPAMGALATAKSTHISVVVPMTGYALCSVFAYYVLFDDKRANDQGNNVDDEKDAEAQGEIEVNQAEKDMKLS